MSVASAVSVPPEDMLRVILELKETERGTLKQEMGGQLRELFEVMGVLGSSGGGQDEASSLAGDKERLWNEFEHKFSVWHGGSIALFEPPPSTLDPSPAPRAGSSTAQVESGAPVEESAPVIPAFVPSSLPLGPLPSPPPRVAMLPRAFNVGPSTYEVAVPMSFILPPPPLTPPPSDSDLELPFDRPPPPRSSPKVQLPLTSEYALSLYPLPVLPVDAARKATRAARRARSTSSVGGSSAPLAPYVPPDLFKWQASVDANPLSALVRSAKKCLGTADWETAINELRFNRAMQQVEHLKQQGRWSFRQPKKQKGPPMAKSHWDWLLEEMNWLQTDFREERKWKTVLAYEMAEWVMEWHCSDDKMSLCVPVGQPKQRSEDGPWPAESIQAGAAETAFDAGVSSDRRADMDDMDVDDADIKAPAELSTLEPSSEVADAAVKSLEVEMRSSEPEVSNEMATESLPKVEADATVVPAAHPSMQVDGDVDALGDVDADGEEDDGIGELDLSMLPSDPEALQPGWIPGPAQQTPTAENPLTPSNSLRPGSENPTLASSEDPQLVAKQLADQVAVARSSLVSASASELTLDLESFSYPSSSSSSSSSLPSAEVSSRILHDLFGDTNHFSMSQPVSESATLSGRMDRRVDDATTSAGKLAITSRLLAVRPVLVSTLQPSKKRRLDQWEDLSDLWGSSDRDLFEFKAGEVPFVASSPLFATGDEKRHRSKRDQHLLVSVPQGPSNVSCHALRITTTIWATEDDRVLQSLCVQYPLNWQLISDSFNTSRRTLSIDRRSPWDCYQRWNKMWNPNRKDKDVELENKAIEAVAQDLGVGEASGRRSSKAPLMAPPGTAIPSDPSRKQLRHAKLYDAMKRTARRRDLTNKDRKPQNSKEPRRVVAPAHESHHLALNPNHPFSTDPAELSALKFDADKRFWEAKRAAYMEARQREEQARLMHAQHQSSQAARAAAGTPPLGPNGVPRQNGTDQQRQQAAALAAMARSQQARLAATAANGGVPPPGGVPAPSMQQLQQLRLLEAQRQQASGRASPSNGGPGGGNGAGRGRQLEQIFANLQGQPMANSPERIASLLVAAIPDDLLNLMQSDLTINNCVVTPQHILLARSKLTPEDVAKKAAKAQAMQAAGHGQAMAHFAAQQQQQQQQQAMEQHQRGAMGPPPLPSK